MSTKEKILHKDYRNVYLNLMVHATTREYCTQAIRMGTLLILFEHFDGLTFDEFLVKGCKNNLPLQVVRIDRLRKEKTDSDIQKDLGIGSITREAMLARLVMLGTKIDWITILGYVDGCPVLADPSPDGLVVHVYEPQEWTAETNIISDTF
jgi:hypothetical protein